MLLPTKKYPSMEPHLFCFLFPCRATDKRSDCRKKPWYCAIHFLQPWWWTSRSLHWTRNSHFQRTGTKCFLQICLWETNYLMFHICYSWRYVDCLVLRKVFLWEMQDIHTFGERSCQNTWQDNKLQNRH